MKESYEDEEEEQGGPKSSFSTYLAEGDALYKQGEFKKAVESYSLALEIQPNDKFCLVARSKCYLKLGDPQAALKDAEAALEDDKEFNRGLYQKAEALYSMGDFEYALMYYHRGHKLRPELDEFRLGIQKAQEAIDNSIGNAAKVKLENKGDLSFFTKQDDLGKKSRGYSKPVSTAKQKPLLTSNRNKETKPPPPSNKTVKQLLGELYSDKEYLEKLMKDTDFISSSANKRIYDLVQDGLTYLDTRTEFWRQQNPLYARKKDKQKPKSKVGKRKGRSNFAQDVIRTLEDIDRILADGQPERALQLSQSTLKDVETATLAELPNKQEVIGNIQSCIGNAYLDMDKPEKALKHHSKDLEISKKSNLKDGISRALDNIGRAYARLGKYDKAVDSWIEKLPLVKSPLESTWLYHEIGRCHLELGNYQDAREFGEKSLDSAAKANDDVWQLNASVLIAQADVKLGDYDQALDSFNKSLDLAKSLNDEAAENAITKAIADVKSKGKSDGKVDEGSSDSETEQKDDADDSRDLYDQEKFMTESEAEDSGGEQQRQKESYDKDDETPRDTQSDYKDSDETPRDIQQQNKGDDETPRDTRTDNTDDDETPRDTQRDNTGDDETPRDIQSESKDEDETPRDDKEDETPKDTQNDFDDFFASPRDEEGQ